MIKEFEPPFFYRKPKPIEDSIKASSAYLFENIIRFVILFFLFNGFYIKALLDGKTFSMIIKESLLICPVFFALFFIHQ
jgi:hypothetical protein